MRLLLDTHVFLWASSEPARLTEAMRAALAGEANEIFVSAASAWEIAIKVAIRRLTFPLDSFVPTLEGMGIPSLPMTVAHGIAAGSLPRHHGDLFDRTLVTTDRALRRYDVAILS